MKPFILPTNLSIQEGIHGQGVFTTAKFKKGQVLFKMQGEIITHPTRTSVQVGKKQHIEDQLAGFMNHSCTPNAKVNRRTRSFICLRDIDEGEEITFDYHQNEEALAAPFRCECCGKEIVGKAITKTESIA